MYVSDTSRPDLLFLILPKCSYVLESTVGFKSNLCKNAICKWENYKNLINDLNNDYRCQCSPQNFSPERWLINIHEYIRFEPGIIIHPSIIKPVAMLIFGFRPFLCLCCICLEQEVTKQQSLSLFIHFTKLLLFLSKTQHCYKNVIK